MIDGRGRWDRVAAEVAWAVRTYRWDRHNAQAATGVPWTTISRIVKRPPGYEPRREVLAQLSLAMGERPDHLETLARVAPTDVGAVARTVVPAAHAARGWALVVGGPLAGQVRPAHGSVLEVGRSRGQERRYRPMNAELAGMPSGPYTYQLAYLWDPAGLIQGAAFWLPADGDDRGRAQQQVLGVTALMNWLAALPW